MVKYWCFHQKNEEVNLLKTGDKIKAASVIVLIVLMVLTIVATDFVKKFKANIDSNELLLADNILNQSDEVVDDENDKQEIEPIIYDGLTRSELIEKINRNLTSTIAGKGDIFVDYTIKTGLDPYLAVAIVLHETGCVWDCSTLVKACNNVGGMKGSPSCGGGSYMAFDTLDEGITSYLDNLYNNFYAVGLTTPEAINPRYAESTAWASKINYYMEKIRAS